MKIKRGHRGYATGPVPRGEAFKGMRRGRLEDDLPFEVKRQMFALLSSKIARSIKEHGVTEPEILSDFAAWRKSKREAARKG